MQYSCLVRNCLLLALHCSKIDFVDLAGLLVSSCSIFTKHDHRQHRESGRAPSCFQIYLVMGSLILPDFLGIGLLELVTN